MLSLRIVLWLALSALLANAATINQVTYNSTSPGYVFNWTGGATEYHCFYTPTGATSPTFVKGTGGYYAYFEGPITNNVATIKYWSILWSFAPNLPQGAGASITYASDLLSLTGAFQPSGTWSADGGVSNTAPTSTELQNCLWAYDTVDGSKPRLAGYWVQPLQPAEGNSYYFCDKNTSSTYGSYEYTTAGVITRGWAALSTTNTQSSTIGVGFDYDTTGSFAGTNYTVLSLAATASATSTTPLALPGFYCDYDSTYSSDTSACYFDGYNSAVYTSGTPNTCAQFVPLGSEFLTTSHASQLVPSLVLMAMLLCIQIVGF